MSLQTFVKISNVTNLSDARYCAGMMVDVIGFNIDLTTENFVSEGDFGEITNWVAGVQFAGEFYGASIEQIRDTLKRYPVDFIEIDNMNLVEQVGLLGKPLIFRLNITENNLSQLKSNLSYLDELVKMVLIRSHTPELYEDLDLQIGYYNGNLRLIKGYGIEAATANLGNYPGLELEATEEDRPGYKDYGQIMDVLELIEED